MKKLFSKLKNKIARFYKSVMLNFRDILSTLIWITLILFIAQIVTITGDKFGIDIHDVRDFVFALGKFSAAILCGVGYISHVTFRDSLGDHDEAEFMNTWNNILTPKERLDWYFRIISVGVIAAAIIFSIGV